MPWLMTPLMPTGDPDHHIIEDMWLGVTVASQGPAGRVLVSGRSPSVPPHLQPSPSSPRSFGGKQRAGEGSVVHELEPCKCPFLWLYVSTACVSLHPALVAGGGGGEGVWRSPRASLGPV